MHALIFLFLALAALFVGATGSPFNGEVASNLANMGTFVGGFFTPVLTVGAVWVAYRQLKDQRQSQHEQAEIKYFSVMANNHLNQANKAYDSFNKNQEESKLNIKNLIAIQNRSSNKELISTKYALNTDIAQQVNLAIKSILEIRDHYQDAKKIANASKNISHEIYIDHIAREDTYKAHIEIKNILFNFQYLKPTISELLEKEEMKFNFFTNKYPLSKAIIALEDPDKE